MDKEENKNSDITVYQSKDGKVSFNVNVFDEAVWLTQKQISLLFERDQSVIARHIRNIFKEDELPEMGNMQKMHNANYHLEEIYKIQELTQNSTIRIFRMVQNEADRSVAKIIKFFTNLGDGRSDLNKTIKGSGIAKKISSELVELGNKLKDWL